MYFLVRKFCFELRGTSKSISLEFLSYMITPVSATDDTFLVLPKKIYKHTVFIYATDDIIIEMLFE